MKKFIIILQYLSGYSKYQCLQCKNTFGVPKDKKDENFVWCIYCGKKEKK